MAFTAADVKTLREMTSVGMMDCKKALVECDGDMDKAVEWLREKGLAKAAKKAGRIAAEGMSYALTENGVGVVVEVNCETDFCAKSELFVAFVKDIAKTIAENAPADVDALMNCKYTGTKLTWCKNICERGYTGSTLAGALATSLWASSGWLAVEVMGLALCAIGVVVAALANATDRDAVRPAAAAEPEVSDTAS